MTRSNAPAYQTGFANHFATEAVEGALPVGRNDAGEGGLRVAVGHHHVAVEDLPRTELADPAR